MPLKIASSCEWWMSIMVAHSIPHGMGEKYISISATVVSWVACVGVSNQSPLCALPAILFCLEQINYQWKKNKLLWFYSHFHFLMQFMWQFCGFPWNCVYFQIYACDKFAVLWQDSKAYYYFSFLLHISMWLLLLVFVLHGVHSIFSKTQSRWWSL